LYLCFWEGRRVRWKLTLALRFSTIIQRMYSGRKGLWNEIWDIAIDDHVAVWIRFVKLFTARSMPLVDFNFTFNLFVGWQDHEIYFYR